MQNLCQSAYVSNARSSHLIAIILSGVHIMGLFGSQLKQVLRRLGHDPVFAAVTVITLAVGIGANTVIFGVLEGILLKPLPYAQPEQLVYLAQTAPGINIPELPGSPSTYVTMREQGHSFQDVGLYNEDSVSITGTGEPEQVHALRITDGILPLLGVPPMLGRSFAPEDDKKGNPETVMLTYGYWQRKFGGDPSVIGKTIKVDSQEDQIIGVTPPKFRFLDEQDVAVLLPFQLDRNKIFLGNFSYESLGRLKPGVSLEQATADLDRLLPVVMQSFPPPEGYSLKMFDAAQLAPLVRPLKKEVVGDVGNALWVLMGSIGLVLLIACANVANLVLVRVEGRRRELAVKAALGARWSRIAYELLLESLVLGLLGSVVGLGLAFGGLRTLVAIAPQGLPRVDEIGIDANVLLFTLDLALVASVLFGSIPILKYAGNRLSTGLREGGRALSQSREQHRARSVLVVFQVALALVLLICSGLMVRTFVALTNVEPGFAAPAQVQTFRVAISETEVKDNERVARMDDEILRRLAAIPGEKAVGAASSIPMAVGGSYDPIFAGDRSYKPGELPPLRRFQFMTPGYVQTLGTPLLAGRDFTWTDIYNKNAVALVSENLAREYWQTPANALGKRIRVATTDDWREIVGVVGNVHDQGVNKEPSATAYWPVMMDKFDGEKTMVWRSLAFALRTSRAGTESLTKEVREAVWAVDANLPPSQVRTLEYFYKNSMARTSFTLLMLAVAGVMALLLGVVGIYGVISYSVSQRTREIGIRMALGAQRGEVTGIFVRHGLLLTAIGVVCGLAAAAVLMRLMASLLFRVNPVDVVTYCAVSVGLVATALLASYLPSRRAATVDPAEVLRAE